MNILRMLSIEGRPTKVGSKSYKMSMEGQWIAELNRPIPLMVNNRVVDLVIPYEIHISQHLTIIFFNVANLQLSDKAITTLTNALISMHEGYIPPTNTRQDSDTERTGMDAATRMMMGETRSARQIGRDAQYGGGYDDDEEEEDLYTMMKRANPHDPLFRD